MTATSQDGQTNTASVTYTVAGAPSAQITTPANGASYNQGQVVDASYTCTDGSYGPGISSCSGPVANGAPINTLHDGPALLHGDRDQRGWAEHVRGPQPGFPATRRGDRQRHQRHRRLDVLRDRDGLTRRPCPWFSRSGSSMAEGLAVAALALRRGLGRLGLRRRRRLGGLPGFGRCRRSGRCERSLFVRGRLVFS